MMALNGTSRPAASEQLTPRKGLDAMGQRETPTAKMATEMTPATAKSAQTMRDEALLALATPPRRGLAEELALAAWVALSPSACLAMVLSQGARQAHASNSDLGSA